jgi:hypothetical protein
MFSAYFTKLEDELLKKYKPSGKGAAAKKNKDHDSAAYSEFTKEIEGMIPSALSAGHGIIVDPSGYSPAPVDVTIYKSLSRKMNEIFGGKIPSELVYATMHIAPILDRKNLLEKLVEVANVKKCERFSENTSEPGFIASFVVAFDTSYTMEELKAGVLSVYKEQDVGSEFEIDIIAVLGKGIMIKNWREQRSYVALETEHDTMKWLYILMNEYLEVDKSKDVDLREFVKDQKHYKEY